MHRGREISGYHDVQDIGSSRGVVWVSGWGVRPKDKAGVPIRLVTQEFPLLVLSLEFQSTCIAFRSQVINTGNWPPTLAYRSASISGRKRREVCVKDFHRSTGQNNLYGNCFQVGAARHRYRVVSNTTPDQYGRANPDFWSVCGMADIVGKPEDLARVRKCLT